MAQFDVHRNRNAASRGRFPLLLDVQAELLEPLATRVVVPLSPASAARGKTLQTLMPTVRVDGKAYVAVVPQLAGVAAADLGPVVANLAGERDAIVAAFDLLITGI
jgi:toxin CcdB